MDALGELAQLLDRRRELADRFPERRIRVVPAALRVAKLQQERDQPLLCAVVQVALEATPRVVGGGDDARARTADLGLVSLAVGDVGAGDQEDGTALDLRQRRAGPGDV